MAEFFTGISDLFSEYFQNYSFLAHGDYYAGLFENYFSVAGFVAGVIMVFLIYMACEDGIDAGVRGIAKIIIIMALANSCVVVTGVLYNFLHLGEPCHKTMNVMLQHENLISGFVMTMVICTVYQNNRKRAFFLGVATQVAAVLLGGAGLSGIFSGHNSQTVLLGIVFTGALCWLQSQRKYFFTGWILYFCAHTGAKLFLFTKQVKIRDLPGFQPGQNQNWAMATGFMQYYTIDLVVFGLVLLFAILMEIGILHKKSNQK